MQSLRTLRVALGVALIHVSAACHLRPRVPSGNPEWSLVTLPGVAAGAQIASLGGSGPQDVWALVHDAQGPNTGTTFFHYDGRAWTRSSAQPAITGYLGDLYATSPSDAWAVGAAGQVAHYDGRAWSLSVISDAAANARTLVRVRAWPGEAWATTDLPDVYRYHFANGAWLQDLAPLPGEVRPFPELWGATARDVWLAGGRSMHFDGAAWSEVTVGRATLRDVHGTASDDVWMVGGRGSSMSQNNWRGAAFHWDGARWTETPVPSGILFLWRVIAVSRTEAWAVGGGADAIRWDGHAWRRTLTGFERTSGLPALRTLYAAGGHVWAAGRSIPGIIEHVDRPAATR